MLEHLPPVAVTLPLVALCALVATWYIQDLLAALRAPSLGVADGLPLDGPLVSVIIPARDEAARIGACLSGLAAQSYRRFEVIVVDDHSSDGTADVVRGFTHRLPSLTVLAGADLPGGWAGKCWACWQGAARARGDLLLFLDADVVPRPALLAAMAARAVDRRLDMLTLVPLVRLSGLAERLVLPAFVGLISAIFPLDRVNDPRSPLAFAIGQCLMLRRAAYEDSGGHRAVRGSVLEDMDLARLVKGRGMRLEALAGPDLIEVRMYNGWSSLAEGLRKNAVAGARSGGRRAALLGLRHVAMVVVPLDLLAAGIWAAGAQPESPLSGLLLLYGAILLAVGIACWGAVVRHRHRASPLWGVLAPLGAAVYFGIAAEATLSLWVGRGVVWKGRVFTR